MIAFTNMFLTYLLLVIISIVVIIAGIFCGKKLREIKDNKDASKAVEEAKGDN